MSWGKKEAISFNRYELIIRHVHAMVHNDPGKESLNDLFNYLVLSLRSESKQKKHLVVLELKLPIQMIAVNTNNLQTFFVKS